MAKLFLDHHCEVDPEDEYGETPLFKASQRGDVEMCQLLVRTIRLLLLLFIFQRYSYSASTYVCLYMHNIFLLYTIPKRPCVFIFVRNNLKHLFSKHG